MLKFLIYYKKTEKTLFSYKFLNDEVGDNLLMSREINLIYEGEVPDFCYFSYNCTFAEYLKFKREIELDLNKKVFEIIKKN